MEGKRCRTKKHPSKKFLQLGVRVPPSIKFYKPNDGDLCYSHNNDEKKCKTDKVLIDKCIWYDYHKRCCLKRDFENQYEKYADRCYWSKYKENRKIDDFVKLNKELVGNKY